MKLILGRGCGPKMGWGASGAQRAQISYTPHPPWMIMIVPLKKKANVQKICCHKEFGLQNRYKNCFDSKWMFICKIVLGQKEYGLKIFFGMSVRRSSWSIGNDSFFHFPFYLSRPFLIGNLMGYQASVIGATDRNCFWKLFKHQILPW